MKVLNQQQAWCSEFLLQFNMVIHFQPSKLGTKPNALMCHWDVYPKEGSSNYTRTHRTFGQYSPMSNWFHPFPQLPSGYQPFGVH